MHPCTGCGSCGALRMAFCPLQASCRVGSVELRPSCMQVVAVPAAALLEPEWDDGSPAAVTSADRPDYASILFG